MESRHNIHEARRIVVQNADDALNNGRLDVASFVAARKFEIEQLEGAMLRSRASAKQRAFQSVPRTLRRRTASHNIKRVPHRLRKRASNEMKADNTPTYKKKKLRGYERVKEMADERTHQKAMSETSSSKIASQSTTKENQRSRHIPQELLQDSRPDTSSDQDSNLNIFPLSTPPTGKLRFAHRQKKKAWLPTHVWHAKRAHMTTLWGFSIAMEPSQKCYRSTHRAANLRGAVAWDSSYFSSFTLTGSLKGLDTVIKTITKGECSGGTKFSQGKRCWEGILYDADSCFIGPGVIYWNRQANPATQNEPIESSLNQYPSPHILSTPAFPSAQIQSPQTNGSVHHTALVRVHPAIFSALLSALQPLCSLHNISFEDCRYSIGSIDIIGPKALSALIAIINCRDSSVNQVWRGLSGLADTGALPKNVSITVNSSDPRLFYPPRLPNKPTDTVQICDFITKWPDELTHESKLFDQQYRTESVAKQPSLKNINKRRSNADPGQPVPLINSDPDVPLIILKHPNNSLTLLLPWDWVLPFWYSLLHVHDVHSGGLDQRHQLDFEAGLPYFPDDFPGTDAGWTAELRKGAELEAEWKRKPAAKRVNYDKTWTGNGELGEIGNPFRCDWSILKQTKNPSANITKDSQVIETTTTLSTATSTLEEGLKDLAVPVARTVTYDKNSLLGIACIRLTLCNRGNPAPRARIYRIPKGLEDGWTEASQKNNDDRLPVCPPADYLIGFVTSGSFNLAQGKGYGIASVMSESIEGDEGLCLVRNVGGTVARLAKWKRI